jgi:hypothetical protein
VPLTFDEAWTNAKLISHGHAWVDHRLDFPEISDEEEFAAASGRTPGGPIS